MDGKGVKGLGRHNPKTKDVYQLNLQRRFISQAAARGELESTQPLNKALVWDRREGNSSCKVLECSSGMCTFRAVLRKEEEGASSWWKVTALSDSHSHECMAYAIGHARAFAHDSHVQHLFYEESAPVKAVHAYLLSEYDYDAEPSFITQIKEHVVAQYVGQREQDMNKLVPLLDMLTYENESFSATLTVQHKEQGGIKVVVLEYSGTNGADSVQRNRDVLKGLKDVKLLSLICIWPWAAASLPLGAPVRSVDAAHVSLTSGYGRMMNVAMRVGKTYVPLATSFCASEDQKSIRALLDALVKCARDVVAPGSVIFSDRGQAVIAAVKAFIADNNLGGQLEYLHCRVHVFRNILQNFRELVRNNQGETSATLVKNILYARTKAVWLQAISKLDAHYCQITGKKAPGVPVDEVAEGAQAKETLSENATLDMHDPFPAPAEYEELEMILGDTVASGVEAGKYDLPSQYIFALTTLCGSSIFVFMTASTDYGLNSTNSVESLNGRFKALKVRDMGIAEAILSILTIFPPSFTAMQDDVHKAIAASESIYRVWPSLYLSKQLDDEINTFHVRDVARNQATVIHNVHKSSKYFVEWFPSGRTSSPHVHWTTRLSPQLVCCAVDCLQPQREHVPCPHVKCVLRKWAESNGDSQEAQVSWSKTALKQMTARFYHLDLLAAALKNATLHGVRKTHLSNLSNLFLLKPIKAFPSLTKDKPAVPKDKPASAAAAASDDAQGDAVANANLSALHAAKRKKGTVETEMTAKHQCRICKKVGHNSRTCPMQPKMASAAGDVE